MLNPKTSIMDFSGFYASQEVKQSVPWVINQDSTAKIIWDCYIMLLLILIIFIIPIRLAFDFEDSPKWLAMSYGVDANFFVDIVLWFFTSYTDKKRGVEVTNHKKIAINYIKTWFFIDVISTLPIDVIFYIDDVNSFLRYTKISKITKLLRLARLFKILKLLKSDNRLKHQFSEKLKINSGTENLVFFSFFFVIFLHVGSCLFITLGTLIDGNFEDMESWFHPYSSLDPIHIYVLSVYYVVTTTATVGYGDISP